MTSNNSDHTETYEDIEESNNDIAAAKTSEDTKTSPDLVGAARDLEKQKQTESVEEKIQSTAEQDQKGEDYEKKYWLLLAEMENMRKRMQKERHELTAYSMQNIISEFLHPLDTFSGAIGCTNNLSDEMRNWVMGFSMILDQFKEVLAQHDVKAFDSLGAHFDPHIHEAVEIEETTEQPDGTITHEFLKGYTMGDKVIRPARVKVAKAPQPKKEEAAEEAAEEKDTKEEISE
jgi:molecular chaperone GrpE